MFVEGRETFKPFFILLNFSGLIYVFHTVLPNTSMAEGASFFCGTLFCLVEYATLVIAVEVFLLVRFVEY